MFKNRYLLPDWDEEQDVWVSYLSEQRIPKVIKHPKEAQFSRLLFDRCLDYQEEEDIDDPQDPVNFVRTVQYRLNVSALKRCVKNANKLLKEITWQNNGLEVSQR